MRHRRTTQQRETHKPQKSTSYYVKIGYLFLLGMLLTGNIFMFASSVKISDQITNIESHIEVVRKENADLQQRVLGENSIQTLEYIARKSGFTEEAQPYYLGETDYAMANTTR